MWGRREGGGDEKARAKIKESRPARRGVEEYVVWVDIAMDDIVSVHPGDCAVRCSVVQCGAVCCSVFQCVTVCCSVLQCVAVCCSVLQCVAVSCSVLP